VGEDPQTSSVRATLFLDIDGVLLPTRLEIPDHWGVLELPDTQLAVTHASEDAALVYSPDLIAQLARPFKTATAPVEPLRSELVSVLAVPPAPDPVVAAHPVGSVIETADGSEGLATATYDDSGQYRYRLSRVWDPALPRCVFTMLNPSTATALVLDPTVTRCYRFASSWGFGALEVVNLFAYRSTDPKVLYTSADPIGPRNDDAILAAGEAADLVVAAWGVHAALGGRGASVRAMLAAADLPLHYLKLTKDGHPGHPLYLPGSSAPTLWAPDPSH
jgi:hypothetical protein